MPSPRLCLLSVNTRPGHRSLSIASLGAWIKETLPNWEVLLLDPFEGGDLWPEISKILDFRPQVIGFTCYCFNLQTTDALTSRLARLLPETLFLAGGPEAAYEPRAFLRARPWVHAACLGEGEKPLEALCDLIQQGQLNYPWPLEEMIRKVAGLAAFPEDDLFMESGPPLLPDLERSPLPHRLWSDSMPGVVYYEASRGCPFRCSYCTSSLTGKVREKSIEKVLGDLKWLSDQGIRTVNFADRTFNHGLQRPLAILRAIAEMNTSMSMQVEIYPEKITRELMAALKEMPSGRLGMEAGFQTSDLDSLKACNRQGNPELALEMISRLVKETKVQVHTDLMAGMPLQTNERLMRDLDALAATGAHSIQINTVKVLPGTALRGQAQALGIRYSPLPPYETLDTPHFSFEELRISEGAATIFYRFHNSGNHCNAEQALLQSGLRVSEFVWDLCARRIQQKAPCHSLSPDQIRESLLEFARKKLKDSPDLERLGQACHLDWALSARPGARVPAFIQPWVINPELTEQTDKYDISEQAGLMGWSENRRFLPAPGLRMVCLREFQPAAWETSGFVTRLGDGTGIIFIRAAAEAGARGPAEVTSEQAIILARVLDRGSATLKELGQADCRSESLCRDLAILLEKNLLK